MSVHELAKQMKLLKKFEYEWKPLYRGYTDKILYINVGSKEVKEKADYVTDKIDNDGLYKAFKYLKLF